MFSTCTTFSSVQFSRSVVSDSLHYFTQCQILLLSHSSFSLNFVTNLSEFVITSIHHLTCLLRNLYVGLEVTVRTGHGTTDWLQIGKEVHQGCILSPCLFNLYAEHIMRNARLDEAQAGIKVARKNINNLRYADDTTLMAESEQEL